MTVTKEQLDAAIKQLNDRIDNIEDNHLSSIYALLGLVSDKVNTNRWIFIAGLAIIAIITGIATFT